MPLKGGLVVALALAGLLLFTGAVASGSRTQLRASGWRASLVNTVSAPKTLSGRLAKTDPSLLGKTSSKLVNVTIKYDLDATASYGGGLHGLAATSPRVTGKPLAKNPIAVKAYDRYANGKIQNLNGKVRAAVPAAKIGYWFQTVYGGVAARVPANSISSLLRIPGVAAVQKDALNHPLDDNTSFIGATNVWPSLGGSGHAGSNVVVGVIDTGIWPEHPMLSATGVSAPAGGLKGCSDFATGGDTAHLGPAFSCNNKLIGAYAKTATYMSAVGSNGQEFCNNTTGACSPRDSEGHGTHTTTTAAGDCVSSAVIYGVERGPVCGIAPGAHIEVFRVCLVQGCFGSDSVAAVGQAITDGVNVINFSISGGAQPYTDAVELAFLDATNAGISVNAAAGNSGPGAGTSDHGGPWVTTVGASTGPRSFNSTLHLTADGGATLDVPGVTLTNGITSPTPVVLANTLPKAGGGTEDALCQSDVAAGGATGKVVVCSRGTNGRIDKGRRVLQGGAAGMILYNTAATTDLESDNHYLPAIQTQFNSNAIANFVSTHTNVMATWAQGTAQPSQADVMASFSSRGPAGDWVKPDVTAPGVQVLAGTTPQPDQTTADNGPPGNLYMAIAGTSMASPHSAGASALVKAAHPTWTPEEIKSALMTSSTQAVVKEDGTTPATPFDMGAGRIQVDRAVNPTLVFNETYAHFVAAGTDTLDRVDLNIPSIDATTFSGDLVTSRTAINVSGASQNMAVQITEPAGVDIEVGNNNHDLHIAKDASLTFPIEISAPDIANGQYFARINLVSAKGSNTVTIPVAFVKKQGTVSLTNTCSPLSIPTKTGVSHCTVTAQNLGTVAANTSVSVASRESGKALAYKNVGLPGSVIGSGDGVQWSGTLTPASAPPVNSINNITGSGPAGGYLSLNGFSGNLLIPGGDDAITNVNVPTFYYGGEAYNRIGVCTDGYIVIGGGDAGDVSFAPQSFPNASRPNNVLAPFWTDLNTTGGVVGNNAIVVNVLGDGDSDWIIVDFESVKNFSNAITHTGEIWIRASLVNHTGPAGEQLTYSYATANASSGDPDESGLAINWGAENRDGSSGKNIASAPANNTEYRPALGPPVPGGQVTLPFDIWSKALGTFHSDASMTSNQTKGTTIASQAITITP
jgi:subtilisin family serine protease